MTKAILYDKTGAAFSFDHEHAGTAYVRPMVKVVVQSSYGDDFHEEEDFEPAAYLVAVDRSSLFDAPPLVAINEDISTKRAELEALKAEAKKVVSEAKSQRQSAEWELQAAKRQLDQWMETHRVMMDLGKLLDGQVLYPLSVSKSHYHTGQEVPRIPTTRYCQYLAITSGDFEKGQKWVAKQYANDSYGNPFRFYDTEEERASVISAEFDATCEAFRKKPDFRTGGYSTTLSYETLETWVKTHPALRIPGDIKGMKTAHEAELVERRKAALAAELAAIEIAS